MAAHTAGQLSSLRSGTEETISASPPQDAGHARGRKRGSVDDTDESSPSSQQPGAGGDANKKRKAAFSTRGVANLTPEQLEKKRANGE